MIKARALLYRSKTLSKGEHPIMICLTKNGQRRYLSTGLNCHPDLWDSKKNEPSRKHPMQKDIEIFISEKLNQIKKRILQAETDGEDLSLDVLSNVIKKEVTQNNQLSDYLDNTIDRMRRNGKIESANILQSTKNAWCRFFQRENFSFEDLNYATIKQFEDFCTMNGNMPNTIFLYLRTMKTAINNGIKEGVIPEKYNPFKEISFAKYRRIKTQKRAISREELQKIEQLRLNPEDSKFHSLNYFLFSYYTGGMNFIDLACLKWDNINGQAIIYVRKKTNEVLNIPLVEPALQILRLYKNLTGDNISNYIFPILNEGHVTPTSISNRLHKVNRSVNLDLKEIGNSLGINTKITTYVARHTFATVMKRNGVPVSLIGQALGHEDEKTTQIYLDSFNMDILQQAFNKLI
jgi:integrase/recombinase XerD